MGNLMDSETMIALSNKESKEENLILEETFNYIKDDKEKYEVTRFGIEDNILIIEFNLHSTYSDNLSKELEKMSIELSDLVHRVKILLII